MHVQGVWESAVWLHPCSTHCRMQPQAGGQVGLSAVKVRNTEGLKSVNESILALKRVLRMFHMKSGLGEKFIADIWNFLA